MFPLAGKDPLTTHGFKDASAAPGRIQEFWEQYPDANIGMPTGAVSGVVVLDIDPRHGGDESLRDLIAQHGSLPETVEVLTGGGGRHLYFQHPGKKIPCRTGFLDGLDLKGDGGYVVVPPSVHPETGKTYAWEVTNPDRLAPIPEWLLLASSNGKSAETAVVLPDTIPNGQRNVTLTSVAGTMRRRGTSDKAILAALLVENQGRCRPPLPEDEVRKIAGSVAQYAPEAAATGQDTDNVVVSLLDVEVRDVDWLWKHRLPRGQITVIDGDPGESKSVLTMEFAATVSTGRNWPDGTPCERGAVLVISAEDELETTITPRLMAASGDRSLVFSLRKEFSLTEACLGELEELAQRCGLALVIIDPLSTAIPAGVTGWNDAEMRRTLRPLQDLARRLNLSVVVVRHLNKGTGKAIYRGQGSIGIVGAVRMALLVSRDPEDRDRRVLAVEKVNIGPEAPSLAYRLQGVALTGLKEPVVRVVWEGQTAHTADSLLTTADERKDDDAKRFLEDTLAGGPLGSDEVIQLAKQQGISKERVWSAKKAAGVRAHKQGFQGRWAWYLPSKDADDAEASVYPYAS